MSIGHVVLHYTRVARIMSPTMKTTWTSLLRANIMSRCRVTDVKVCRRRAGRLDLRQMGAENCVVPTPFVAWCLDLVAASDLESVIVKHTFALGYLLHNCCCCCCYDPSMAKEIRIL